MAFVNFAVTISGQTINFAKAVSPAAAGVPDRASVANLTFQQLDLQADVFNTADIIISTQATGPGITLGPGGAGRITLGPFGSAPLRLADLYGSGMGVIRITGVTGAGGVDPMAPELPAGHHTTHETGGSDQVTTLDATVLKSGTIDSARLPANLARLDATQMFTGVNTFEIRTTLLSELNLEHEGYPAQFAVTNIPDEGLYIKSNKKGDGSPGVSDMLLLGESGAASFPQGAVQPIPRDLAALNAIVAAIPGWWPALDGILANIRDSTTNTPGQIVSGGGTTSVLARHNGTNWIVVAGPGSATQGVWQTVPFDPAVCFSGPNGTWTATSDQIKTQRFSMVGNVLHYMVSAVGVTLSGSPSVLGILLPPGHFVTTGFSTPCLLSAPTNEVGIVAAASGYSYVEIYRLGGTAYPAGPVSVYFSITLEVN